MSLRNFDLDPQTLGRLPLLRSGAGKEGLRAYERVDAAVVSFLRDHAFVLLRLALAVVFIWFGALKVIGRSPVYQLVADTVPFSPGSVIVPAFGVLEIAIGVGLLAGIGLRVVLLLFVMQMLGTFLVFVTQPGESFQDGNPLLLTTTGEFVLKNVVLIAAGLTVGATVSRSHDEVPGTGAVEPAQDEEHTRASEGHIRDEATVPHTEAVTVRATGAKGTTT